MFTWNENVAFCIIPFLGDPELIIYFMSILKPMRRDYVEEESREWHKSLRITQEERWLRVAELRNKKKFSEMDGSVPITCTLPFDGGMWRNSRDLLKIIHYFREGFIKSEILEEGIYLCTEEELISNKIKLVNILYEESMRSNIIKSEFSIFEIEEALNDLIEFKNPMFEEEIDQSMMPYITIMGILENLPPKDCAYSERYSDNDFPYVAIRN